MSQVAQSQKTAIVTGGRRGIGYGIAMAMRAAGYKVVVVAKSADRGDLPQDVEYVRRDLSKSVHRANLVYRADVLVNNAGTNAFHDADKFPLDVWGSVLEVNLTAAFDLSVQAYRSGCKRIINIASMNSFNGARRCVAYVAAKHGLVGMTKCLSNEWAKDGVTVNCVAPGYVATDMLESLTSDPKHAQEMLGRIPAGKFGEPRDVAAAVLFLASEEARYVTGSTIMVDGGWMGR